MVVTQSSTANVSMSADDMLRYSLGKVGIAQPNADRVIADLKRLVPDEVTTPADIRALADHFDDLASGMRSLAALVEDGAIRFQ
jgi:hypothetical protein